MSLTPEVEAELEAALVPLRAAQPGISNHEAAKLLPAHLVGPLWERAVDRHLSAELAKLPPERPTTVERVSPAVAHRGGL